MVYRSIARDLVRDSLSSSAQLPTETIQPVMEVPGRFGRPAGMPSLGSTAANGPYHSATPFAASLSLRLVEDETL